MPRPALAFPRAPAAVTLSSQSCLPLGIDPKPFTAALQRYVDEYLVPMWGCPAVLTWADKPLRGTMNLVFRDELEDDAIAYHNFDTALTALPYGMIGVVAAYESGYGLGLATSHELGEMLVNPGIGLWASYGEFNEHSHDSRLRALEIADPVEETWFDIDGVHVSNFVYPAYFEPWRDGRLDFLGLLKDPGELLSGGYQIVRDHEKEYDEDPDELSRKGSRRVCWRAAVTLRRLRGTRLHTGTR